MPYPFSYGDVNGGAQPRPRCWGLQFSQHSSECRGCNFQGTCKDQYTRATVNAPAPVPAPMIQQPGVVMQQQVPQMVPAPRAVVPFVPAPVIPQAQQQVHGPQVQQYRPQGVVGGVPALTPAQQQQVLQQMQIDQDWYGRVQDPMFYTITTAPPLLRPQFPGETYSQRLLKNVGLAMAEAAVGQCWLFVRQILWPPRNNQHPPVQPDPTKVG